MKFYFDKIFKIIQFLILFTEQIMQNANFIFCLYILSKPYVHRTFKLINETAYS